MGSIFTNLILTFEKGVLKVKSQLFNSSRQFLAFIHLPHDETNMFWKKKKVVIEQTTYEVNRHQEEEDKLSKLVEESEKFKNMWNETKMVSAVMIHNT